MKRALVTILAATALLPLISCGGGGSSNSGTTPKTSAIVKRALVSDRFHGVLYIIDATDDIYRGNSLTIGSAASLMAVMPDKKNTIIFDPSANRLVVLNNTTEQIGGSLNLADFTESIAVSSDNKSVYAAVRNAPVTGQPNGSVIGYDISAATGTAATTIAVPAVRRLVISHNGSKLLAFSDNSDQVAVIDTATKAVTYVSGFDRPVSGVFSSDDSTAYILSCGKECGGTTARVNALAMATGTVGPNVIVSGATTALLDGTNLYVAGNNAGGKLDVISTGTMTVSKSGVAITDGYHSLMALAANGRLYIGSTGCSNTAAGCLSIYNTSSGSVVNSAAGTGDVTGIQPITGRNMVYVTQGFELVIWDSSADAPIPASRQIDVVGQAYDVKLID